MENKLSHFELTVQLAKLTQQDYPLNPTLDQLLCSLARIRFLC